MKNERLLQVRIDKNLLQEFKILTIKQNKTIKSVIENFIKQYIENNKKD